MNPTVTTMAEEAGTKPPRLTVDNDPIRKRILNRALDLDIALNEASRKVGKNSAYIHQFLYRGTPRVLPEQVRHDLASILQVPEMELRHDRQATVRVRAADRPAPARAALGMVGPRDLTVIRVRPAGGKEINLPQATTRESLPRPINLLGVEGAFAVRVRGGTCEPRYRQGDIVYFHPGVIPRVGDGIVVETKEGDRVGGILQLIDKDEIVIEVLTPRRREKFKISQLALVAREVGVQRA